MKFNFKIKKVDWRVATLFVQQRHYSAVMPKLTKHYLGAYVNDELVGVLTLGWGTQPKATIAKLFKGLDTKEDYDNHDVKKYRNKYVKLIVVNKKDLYKFDKFTDRLLKADCHEVKIVEDFSDLDANTVSDDIVKNTEDTMTLLGKYIDELEVDLDKKRLKDTVSLLYHEAQDLEL